MNRTEHLLSCLAEECAEVAHNASKAMRFGLRDGPPGNDTTNADLIAAELRDLWSVAVMLHEAGLIPPPWPTATEAAAKHQKVEKFMRYAVEQGALEASHDVHHS